MAHGTTKYSSINDDQDDDVKTCTTGQWESGTCSDQYEAIAIKWVATSLLY